MWAATAAATVYCAKRVREESDPAKVPLMGVTGAFIFAAQMVNFSIPGTGSSGHLGGGLILALLLGPEAAFLVMASVLAVQALFFADGGLLALGANIFNLGFFPAFVALPFVYRRIAGEAPARGRVFAASLAAAVVGLQLGALGVVLETVSSGVSELPFAAFLLTMQPIHLAIGIVEGLVTAGVVLFATAAQPDMLARVTERRPLAGVDLRTVLVGLAVAAVVAAGALSWFASADPDGLEWSIEKVTGGPEIEGSADAAANAVSAALQEKTAFMPDYGLPSAAEAGRDAGTGLAGIVGAAITLAVAGLVGLTLRRRRARAARRASS
jgi:cobalt/nickel transport system permease protein